VTTLTIRDLSMAFSGGGTVVRPIEGFDLNVGDGELVLLLGASGCGKTTLLSALAALLRPASGTIRLDDTDVTALQGKALTDYRSRRVGVVFQSFNLVPSLSALENVAVPMWNVGMGTRESRARARALLEGLGLTERLHHRPADMSGGQQQRVAIARALALDPLLLLADEPTAHLDHAQVTSVVRLIREAACPGRIAVVATHDERLLPIADRVVELSERARRAVVAAEQLDLVPGELVFAEGDPGELVYVVEKGEIELVQRREDGAEEVIGRLGAGRYFGELAPAFGLPRTATARAASAAVVRSMPLDEFRRDSRPVAPAGTA
jgi:putative ABC transport system ATP-binding protein